MVQKDNLLQTYEDYVLDSEAKGYIPWCRQWWEDQQEETDDSQHLPHENCNKQTYEVRFTERTVLTRDEYDLYVIEQEALGIDPMEFSEWQDWQVNKYYYPKPIQPLDPEDLFLSACQLDNKYNYDGDGEHPVYTRATWISAVVNENTIQGYWHWLAYILSLQEAPK